MDSARENSWTLPDGHGSIRRRSVPGPFTARDVVSEYGPSEHGPRRWLWSVHCDGSYPRVRNMVRGNMGRSLRRRLSSTGFGTWSGPDVVSRKCVSRRSSSTGLRGRGPHQGRSWPRPLLEGTYGRPPAWKRRSRPWKTYLWSAVRGGRRGASPFFRTKVAKVIFPVKVLGPDARVWPECPPFRSACGWVRVRNLQEFAHGVVGT